MLYVCTDSYYYYSYLPGLILVIMGQALIFFNATASLAPRPFQSL